MNGGSCEIRTHGGLQTHAGFQDRCIQPLCQTSKGSKNGGSCEIRTHGGLQTHAGFQDRCIQPLCQTSVGVYYIDFLLKCKYFFNF